MKKKNKSTYYPNIKNWNAKNSKFQIIKKILKKIIKILIFNNNNNSLHNWYYFFFFF